MDTPSTTADQQGSIETIPESMPQLQRLEESFANFLEQYELFIKESGEEFHGQQLLENFSNDKVTVTYRNEENMEGSFYFRDNETGDEIRFRTAGTGGNHTYMRDSSGREQLFLYNLDPAKGRNVNQALRRIQERKEVSSISDNGIDVAFQTEDDIKRKKEATTRHYELSNQIKSSRANIFKALWNRKEIQELEASLLENTDPTFNREKYLTKKTIPAVESEAIFERFNRIITVATDALRQR
jgi:hypothetical protein